MAKDNTATTEVADNQITLEQAIAESKAKDGIIAELASKLAKSEPAKDTIIELKGKSYKVAYHTFDHNGSRVTAEDLAADELLATELLELNAGVLIPV